MNHLIRSVYAHQVPNFDMGKQISSDEGSISWSDSDAEDGKPKNKVRPSLWFQGNDFEFWM